MPAESAVQHLVLAEQCPQLVVPERLATRRVVHLRSLAVPGKVRRLAERHLQQAVPVTQLLMQPLAVLVVRHR